MVLIVGESKGQILKHVLFRNCIPGMYLTLPMLQFLFYLQPYPNIQLHHLLPQTIIHVRHLHSTVPSLYCCDIINKIVEYTIYLEMFLINRVAH